MLDNQDGRWPGYPKSNDRLVRGLMAPSIVSGADR